MRGSPQSWVSVPCNLLKCCHIFLSPAICILLTVLTVSAWQETKLFLRATIWPQLFFLNLSYLLKLFLELLDQAYSWDQIRQQLLVSMSELVSHPPCSGSASDFQPPRCPKVSISRTPQVSASIEKLLLICSCPQLWFVLRYNEDTDFAKATQPSGCYSKPVKEVAESTNQPYITVWMTEWPSGCFSTNL